jgi:plasmid stabilization system protein ParE
MAQAFNVVVMPLAERDLTGIAAYIAEDSPERAAEFSRRLLRSLLSLETLPRRGRSLGFRMLGELVREKIEGDYRIMYVVRGRDVIVMRVVHGAREDAPR